MQKYLIYSLFAFFIIALDQWSKWAILTHFEYAERLNIITNFFDLTLVYNPGAAFSFLANMGGIQKYIFTILAFVISLWLGRLIQKGELTKWGNWGAVMIIGGAMGNVIDRFVHGHVIDFLLFYWKTYYYPAFNVADSFICVGAILLVVSDWYHKRNHL